MISDLLECNIDKLDWENLSGNPGAIPLLEAYPERIYWKNLSFNEAAIHLLEANPDKINWYNLCRNPGAIKLLEANYDKIKHYGDMLSMNPDAISILEKHPDIIDWDKLSRTLHYNSKAIPLYQANLDKIDKHEWRWLSELPNAIALLEANPDKICWDTLSKNSAAIHLLEANPDKIYWTNLSANPAAIHLLEANPDKIYWTNLSANPAAIHLLEANPQKINWKNLSSNSSPSAVRLLKLNFDKINWTELCYNPAAISLLEANPDKIPKNMWNFLASKPEAIRLFEEHHNNDAFMNYTTEQHLKMWSRLSANSGSIPLLEKHFRAINWSSLSSNTNIMKLNINNDEFKKQSGHTIHFILSPENIKPNFFCEGTTPYFTHRKPDSKFNYLDEEATIENIEMTQTDYPFLKLSNMLMYEPFVV
jgi:hypothetical protein